MTKSLYLRLPFNPELLIKGKQHPLCSQSESIAQNLQLLMTTYYGECKFDESFGSPVWDADFENIASINVWRNKTAKALEEVLKAKEKRLSAPIVTVNLSQEELRNELTSSFMIKRKIEIIISAKIEATNDLFEFNTEFYFSPISFD